MLMSYSSVLVLGVSPTQARKTIVGVVFERGGLAGSLSHQSTHRRAKTLLFHFFTHNSLTS